MPIRNKLIPLTDFIWEIKKKNWIQDMVFALLKRFGPDKTFKDDLLLKEIVSITDFREVAFS